MVFESIGISCQVFVGPPLFFSLNQLYFKVGVHRLHLVSFAFGFMLFHGLKSINFSVILLILFLVIIMVVDDENQEVKVYTIIFY